MQENHVSSHIVLLRNFPLHPKDFEVYWLVSQYMQHNCIFCAICILYQFELVRDIKNHNSFYNQYMKQCKSPQIKTYPKTYDFKVSRLSEM